MWVMEESARLYLPSIPRVVWLPWPDRVNARRQGSLRSSLVFSDPEERRDQKNEENFFLFVLNCNTQSGLQTVAFLPGTACLRCPVVRQRWADDVFRSCRCMSSGTQFIHCYDWNDEKKKKSAIFGNCSQEWNWFTPNRAWNNIGRWHCSYCA